jgi:hypothetical protein
MGRGADKRSVRWWGIAAGVALAGAGVGPVIAHQRSSPAPPHVDAALERSVLPVVDRYVLTAPQGPLGSERPARKDPAGPRAFCTERVVEIRPAGTALRVGLVAWCAHYVRRGDTVTELDGGVTAGVLTVTPVTSPARVTAAFWEPDDTLSTWAPAHFSAGGSAEVERILGNAGAHLTDPVARARAAFGLHAGR